MLYLSIVHHSIRREASGSMWDLPKGLVKATTRSHFGESKARKNKDCIVGNGTTRTLGLADTKELEDHGRPLNSSQLGLSTVHRETCLVDSYGIPHIFSETTTFIFCDFY